MMQSTLLESLFWLAGVEESCLREMEGEFCDEIWLRGELVPRGDVVLREDLTLEGDLMFLDDVMLLVRARLSRPRGDCSRVMRVPSAC